MRDDRYGYWGKYHKFREDEPPRLIWIGPMTRQEMLDHFEAFRHQYTRGHVKAVTVYVRSIDGDEQRIQAGVLHAIRAAQDVDLQYMEFWVNVDTFESECQRVAQRYTAQAALPPSPGDLPQGTPEDPPEA